MVVDNSSENFDLTEIAHGSFLNIESISNSQLWDKLINDYGK